MVAATIVRHDVVAVVGVVGQVHRGLCGTRRFRGRPRSGGGCAILIVVRVAVAEQSAVAVLVDVATDALGRIGVDVDTRAGGVVTVAVPRGEQKRARVQRVAVDRPADRHGDHLGGGGAVGVLVSVVVALHRTAAVVVDSHSGHFGLARVEGRAVVRGVVVAVAVGARRSSGGVAGFAADRHVRDGVRGAAAEPIAVEVLVAEKVVVAVLVDVATHELDRGGVDGNVVVVAVGLRVVALGLPGTAAARVGVGRGQGHTTGEHGAAVLLGEPISIHVGVAELVGVAVLVEAIARLLGSAREHQRSSVTVGGCT